MADAHERALPPEQPLTGTDSDDGRAPQMRSGLKGYTWNNAPRGGKTLLHKKTSPDTEHDMAFTCLRLKIFQIDPWSAAPITDILRGRLGDANTFDLVNGNTAKLKVEISKARKVHSINLRKGGLIDVDIKYTAHKASVPVFEADKDAIEKAGGRVYHLWPFNTETQTLSMSVIVQPELLERVYKSKHTHSHELRNRLAEGGIHITTNTAQASGISVMLDDKHEISIYGDNLEERRAQIDHAIEEICGRRSEISGFSSYSTKVPKVVDIRSTTVNFKWRTYSSSNWPIVMPPNNHDTMRYEGFVVKEAEANPSAQKAAAQQYIVERDRERQLRIDRSMAEGRHKAGDATFGYFEVEALKRPHMKTILNMREIEKRAHKLRHDYALMDGFISPRPDEKPRRDSLAGLHKADCKEEQRARPQPPDGSIAIVGAVPRDQYMNAFMAEREHEFIDTVFISDINK